MIMQFVECQHRLRIQDLTVFKIRENSRVRIFEIRKIRNARLLVLDHWMSLRLELLLSVMTGDLGCQII